MKVHLAGAPLLAVVVALAAGTAAAAEIRIPGEVFYFQPAASVFASEANWVNPAGLGHDQVNGFQFIADYRDDKFLKSWGGAVARQGIGFAARTIDNPAGDDFSEWLIAFGTPLGRRMSGGFSYREFNEGPAPFTKRHFWNVGFQLRTKYDLSLGAVFSNLNRGRIDGERSAAIQQYSAAYRPLGERLTLAVEAVFSSQGIDDADFVYHGEVSPVDGLYFNGLYDSDDNFQVGVRVNLVRYFAGVRTSGRVDGKHRGTSLFVGATDRRQPSLIAEPGRRLALAVSGRPAENPVQPLFGNRRSSFLELVLAIHRAAADRSIAEMVLNLRGVSLGMAQAQELREALMTFRQSGKLVVCHVEHPNNIAYFVASACDSVLIPPISQLNLVGLRAELTFYGGTLDKLGIAADVVAVGEYKTAPEAYTRRSSSEAHREQVNRLLDDLYEQFVGAIAEGRDLSRDSVAALIDRGPFTSQEALAAGLVDALVYRDQLATAVLSPMPEVHFRQYLTDSIVTNSWEIAPAIAVVVAEGDVDFSDGSENPFGGGSLTPSSLTTSLAEIRARSDIKAWVLRVNSPGGFALAGEDLHREIARTAAVKPLTVSMGNVAASAAYYFSMPAEYSFALPATITGSIGIFGGKADLSGLYEKIDLGKELYVRGKLAGMMTMMRPFSDDERARFGSQLETMYEHFVELVAEGRHLSTDSVRELGGGRVWTGNRAEQVGLVDRIGSLHAALEFSARRANLSDYCVEVLPRRRQLFDWPFRSPWNLVARLLGVGTDEVGSVMSFATGGADGAIMARLPYDLVIE